MNSLKHNLSFNHSLEFWEENRLLLRSPAQAEAEAVLDGGAGSDAAEEGPVSFDTIDDAALEAGARKLLDLPAEDASVSDISSRQRLEPEETANRVAAAEAAGNFAGAPSGAEVEAWWETRQERNPYQQQAENDTGKATGAIVDMLHSWMRSWKSGLKVPRSLTKVVAQQIDIANENVASTGENLMRTARQRTKHVGEKELAHLQRLSLREEEARNTGRDIQKRLEASKRDQVNAAQTLREIPTWRVGLKAQAWWLSNSRGLRERWRTATRSEGSDTLFKRAVKASATVEAEAQRERVRIENRFETKLKQDDRRRSAIFERLGIPNNETNNHAIDEIARSDFDLELLHYTSAGTPLGRFLDQVFSLPPDQRKLTLIELKSMRSSIFGETNAADYRVANAEIEKEMKTRKKAEAQRQRLKEATEKMENQWQAALEQGAVVEDGEIELRFAEKGTLSGKWAIANVMQKGAHIEVSKQSMGGVRRLTLERASGGRWRILSGRENILPHLTSIRFSESS